MMATAMLVKDVSEKFTGIAKLYKVDPSAAYDRDWDTDEYREESGFVVSSAADVMFSGRETYLFPADSEGNVFHWCELHGSFRGAMDCDAAIKNAGYEICEPS